MVLLNRYARSNCCERTIDRLLGVEAEVSKTHMSSWDKSRPPSETQDVFSQIGAEVSNSRPRLLQRLLARVSRCR